MPIGASIISTAANFAGIAAIVTISLAAIAATCILIGMATFAAVLFYAISRGYDIENAGYMVAVGEGESRQEHQMVFSLRQPTSQPVT